jgi:hypothetical protein
MLFLVIGSKDTLRQMSFTPFLSDVFTVDLIKTLKTTLQTGGKDRGLPLGTSVKDERLVYVTYLWGDRFGKMIQKYLDNMKFLSEISHSNRVKKILIHTRNRFKRGKITRNECKRGKITLETSVN